LFGFCAKPAEGVGTLPAGKAAGRIPLFGTVWTAAVLLAGELAGAWAAAGVSQAAAKAIAHPNRLICTPGNLVEPETQVRAAGVVGSIGAAFQTLKRLMRSSAEVLKAPAAEPNGRPAMMSDDEILAEFRRADALLEGHFILSSGLRSPRYLQCARVLMDPARAERLARELASRIPNIVRDQVAAVVSPAMGGVIIGHEIGRALGKPAMFLERPQGVFEFRRGFTLVPGAKVLMVEDVVTTGLSSREAIDAVRAAGGEVLAEAALVDRSSGSADLGVPFFPLIRIDVPTYEAEAVPPELAAIPATKPGSRAAA
jgi:orotate phosphoribosyltransferase